jgi:pyruvate kinase
VLRELHLEQQPLPRIISKIESTEALENFDSILAVSDGIMVARGDLAVEIPMESVANVQKLIVHACNLAAKPVIVATQMLESMQKNPRPTRAEASDVANAIYDGADCVMLSGESANGKYPMQSVDMMRRIVHQAELAVIQHTGLNSEARISAWRELSTPSTANLSTVQAVVHAAIQASKSLDNLGGIVVDLHDVSSNVNEIDSELVTTLSALRPQVPVFCLVRSYKAGRLLQMHRALHPILTPPGELSAIAVKTLLQRLQMVEIDQALVFLQGASKHALSLTIVA